MVLPLAFFGSAEALVRLVYPLARTATLPDTMIRNHLQSTGFVYHPDLYWYWAHLPSAAMQINEFGFRRSKPMTLRKPEGRKRVVTLGDSQTLGAGVDVEASYSGVAERELGEGWEVLNAGIAGYRSLNVYRLLKLRIQAFEPDAVLIDCMPYDSARDDGEPLSVPIGGRAELLRAWLWRSHFYRLLRLAVGKLDPSRPRWLDRPPVPRDGLGYGNHDLIAAWGAEQGIHVLFMQYPTMQHDRLRCSTADHELPPDTRVVRACDALEAEGRPARELFQDMNHMTEAGNEVVGRLLARELKALLE